MEGLSEDRLGEIEVLGLGLREMDLRLLTEERRQAINELLQERSRLLQEIERLKEALLREGEEP